MQTHAGQLNRYLDRYVPVRPNLSGMQQTPLYIEEIR